MITMWTQLFQMLQIFFSCFIGSIRTTSFPQPLTAEEEQDALQRMAKGDVEARADLIEHNLRLVAHIVKKFDIRREQTEDLISIGTIGLIKGIDTFKVDKGHKLATYVSRCIENAILSQMRLWFRINPLRAEKHQNGVFWHRFPRIFTYSAPLRRAM
ncbi:sigma-70 family RNA polymerase sigma factor [Holdemania sp. 1001095H_141210_F2]|uniref:sigma-70 family RNA polymerase sigma factor n=2 Tax=unclassified Holdemania TaxID=2637685 RepID=UPI00351C0119